MLTKETTVGTSCCRGKSVTKTLESATTVATAWCTAELTKGIALDNKLSAIEHSARRYGTLISLEDLCRKRQTRRNV